MPRNIFYLWKLYLIHSRNYIYLLLFFQYGVDCKINHYVRNEVCIILYYHFYQKFRKDTTCRAIRHKLLDLSLSRYTINTPVDIYFKGFITSRPFRFTPIYYININIFKHTWFLPYKLSDMSIKKSFNFIF